MMVTSATFLSILSCLVFAPKCSGEEMETKLCKQNSFLFKSGLFSVPGLASMSLEPRLWYQGQSQVQQQVPQIPVLCCVNVLVRGMWDKWCVSSRKCGLRVGRRAWQVEQSPPMNCRKQLAFAEIRCEKNRLSYYMRWLKGSEESECN